MNSDDAAQALALLLRHRSQPMWQVLRDEEIKRGYTPVPVGSVPWLPAEDWHEHDCVSFDAPNEVRIVAIAARQPGTGAFTRLVLGIIDAGFVPVVVCPLATMEEIMGRWGWRRTEIGSTFNDREDQWRPRRLRKATGRPRTLAGTITPPDAAARAGGPVARQGDGNG